MGKRRQTNTPEQSHEQFRVGFQVTDTNLEAGTFRGCASVFGSPVDAWIPTIVDRGAFAKTLAMNGGHVPILWQHDPSCPIGVPVSMQETDLGLEVVGKISMTDMGKEALTLMRDGVVTGLSIGFDPVVYESVKQPDGSEVRHLKEVKLWEFSVVTFPADPNARISAVHSVVAFQDLPLGPEDAAWDKSAAEQRVRDWAGGGSDLADMDWEKYRKAFVWYDSADSEKAGSYKLMIADIVGGTLKAIPRGIYAAAGALQGARGGVNIPANDKDTAKAHLARYYKKLGKIPPWQTKAGRILGEALDARAQLAAVVTHAQADPDTLSTLIEVLEGANEMISSALELLEDALGLPEDEPSDSEGGMEGMARVLSGLRHSLTRHEGKVLSKKNATLVQDAIAALQKLIDSATPEPDSADSEKAHRAAVARTLALCDADLALGSAIHSH